jgi:hypothetical protein
MLRGLKGLSRQKFLFRKTFGAFSSPFSTREDPLEYEYEVPAPKRDICFSQIKFEENFNASKVVDIHDVKEGGWVDLPTEELERLMPEGLAGEIFEEFEFSER